MRTKLVVIFLLYCAAYSFAGQLPLTVKEINLMLRSGYSSETIIRDLAARHFGDTLSQEAQNELLARGMVGPGTHQVSIQPK